MSPTILSLWLPHLPTDRRAAGGPAEAAGAGRVTVAKVKGAQRIAAADRTAAAAGIRPGMSLADARAIRPALTVEAADPGADAALLDDIAAWCSRFTPLVAFDGPDGLVLDIAGAAHLFGGEAALMRTIEDALGRRGIEGRAAIAATPEAAWALARFGTMRMGPPPGDPMRDKAFRRIVEPLPLAALRLDPETIRIMAQAGLRHVGDLLWRPRAPLAARFGEALFVRLDALMGTAKTPISPRFEPPAFVAEQRFASPIATEADILRTLRALAHHLCALMERHDKGARRIEARLFRVDGAVKRLVVGTSRPLLRADDLARLFVERIAGLGEEGLDTGYGFDVVRLGVLVAETADRRQETLLAEGRRAGDDLAGLVDRLGARLGPCCVGHLAARQTHIPERAAAFVTATFIPRAGDGGAPPRAGRPQAKAPSVPDAGSPIPGRIFAPGQEAISRPIRLFAHPEPIATMAEVPDGPPVWFRWRRTTHEVAAIEGPERIAPEWWAGDPRQLTRDYFRAEDREGRQFWLFREGLFVAETADPRWFVHGLFG